MGTTAAGALESGNLLVTCVTEIAEADQFILSRRVAELELKVAELGGWGNAIACASGTGAVLLALTALGVGSGDEVLMPAFACVPAAAAVVLTGATPVFADVDTATMSIDPQAAEAAVGPRTRGLLWSRPLSVTDPGRVLRELARRRGLFILDDTLMMPDADDIRDPAADPLHSRSASHLTDLTAACAFSLGPRSSFGACADAGMVVTHDSQLADSCRTLRNHGQRRRFVHDYVGFNCRMDEITAAYLLHRIPLLQAELRTRRSLAGDYAELLRPLSPYVRVRPQEVRSSSAPGYVILASRRDELRGFLSREGIGVATSPAVPLHREPAFAQLGYKPGQFPGAELLGREWLALPMNEGMRLADIRLVAEKISGFFQRNGA